MPLLLIVEFREAARQARALSQTLVEPKEKQRFAGLAMNWDAQAETVIAKLAAVPKVFPKP